MELGECIDISERGQHSAGGSARSFITIDNLCLTSTVFPVPAFRAAIDSAAMSNSTSGSLASYEAFAQDEVAIR